ncbi:helix-turn-helix transcriptional regulator [Acetobacter persici]|uniref:helix-turn-helix transcriptional regulator n=1 Tax=Acetobacter persici TaxID=1076596 RepID=UPI0039E8D94B
MPISVAAQYIGISVSSFRNVVAKDVAPVYMTVRRPVWLREDLDRWVNNKAGRAQNDVDPDEAELDRILDRHSA